MLSSISSRYHRPSPEATSERDHRTELDSDAQVTVFLRAFGPEYPSARMPGAACGPCRLPCSCEVERGVERKSTGQSRSRQLRAFGIIHRTHIRRPAAPPMKTISKSRPASPSPVERQVDDHGHEQRSRERQPGRYVVRACVSLAGRANGIADGPPIGVGLGWRGGRTQAASTTSRPRDLGAVEEEDVVPPLEVDERKQTRGCQGCLLTRRFRNQSPAPS